MLLSTFFLNAKYSRIHVQSAFVCLLGLALLIWGDTIDDDDATSKLKLFNEMKLKYLMPPTENHSWIGDIICVSFK
jgi:solute carrier family 35 protein F1/2